MKVLWSPLAIDRIEEAVDYIAEDSPMAADRWVERVFDAVEKLVDFPRSGRVLPEVGEDNIRELLVGEYRVIYRIVGDQIRVLTVRHGRRLFDESEVDE